MRQQEVAFDDEIAPYFPGVTALVGGGGKTSLLFALAQALAARGERVLCTTTTRMLLPEKTDWLAVAVGAPLETVTASKKTATFAALFPTEEKDAGKVRGYAAPAVDAYWRSDREQCIIVEADGAARKPIKAPAEHEPVIPSLTTAVIAVVGLSCMGRPLSEETAFRAERLAALAGVRLGDAITPAAVARLASHPEGMFKSAPPHAARLLFCNQSDLPGAATAGAELATEIRRLRPDFLRGIYAGALHAKGLRCLSYPTR